MSVSLTGVVGDLSNLIPSSSDVLQQVIVGAGASVVLAGLKTNAGVDAIDPLHIFHKDGGSTIVGKTIPASAFNTLDAAGKAQVLAAGTSIVAG
jgi:hypothetical protein